MAMGPNRSVLEVRLEHARMRLAARLPFFGVLCLHADHVVRVDVATARTDGRRIEYGEAYCGGLDDAALTGLMLHEVLHCALAHVPRMRGRDALVWNVAADIVVNEVVAQAGDGIRLPVGAVRKQDLVGLRTEAVYDRLLASAAAAPIGFRGDLVSTPLAEGDPWSVGVEVDEHHTRGGGRQPRDPDPATAAADEAYWKDALAAARQLERSRGDLSQVFGPQGPGTLGSLLERLVEERLEALVDWRTALWQHVVQSPDDFTGLDRRLVGYGLYLEELNGERLDVVVCVDTSGSVDRPMLAAFLGEVRAIAAAHDTVRVTLYYADAALDGPHELDGDWRLPKPRGGGGTDFRPFFARVDQDLRPHAPAVLVYLTDGYGTFPEREPAGATTIWAVPEAARETRDFPFGTVIRMAAS
jgi:predicted metal-dependent peptidase